MIISQTPFRVSLFGGGTDYPNWFRDHGGVVLGMAIDKYCYISARYLPPFFEHKHRIVYSKIENVSTIDEIEHPAVRAVFKEMDIKEGLEIHHDGDLPARSGLGSSSSFVVGLLHALNALEGRVLSKNRLAEKATVIEQEVIRENVGNQDQLWAAHGGFHKINFDRRGTADLVPIILSADRERELLKSLMLFHTGISRFASDIAGEKIANMVNRQGHLRAMADMVGEAEKILSDTRRPMKELGALLHESWMLKRELANGVANQRIDEIYEGAREAGAAGGKLLGAGGGGFMLFCVEPEDHDRVRRKLGDLIEVPFAIDRTGSRVMILEPHNLEPGYP